MERELHNKSLELTPYGLYHSVIFVSMNRGYMAAFGGATQLYVSQPLRRRIVPKLTDKDYLPVPEYQDAIGAFHGVAVILLFEFARNSGPIREIIIRDFIARTDAISQSIFTLWKNKDYHDCWVLHRCLLDRLFHIHHLNAANEFEQFEAWSFWKQYKALDRIRSNPAFRETWNPTAYGGGHVLMALP